MLVAARQIKKRRFLYVITQNFHGGKFVLQIVKSNCEIGIHYFVIAFLFYLMCHFGKS